MYYNTLVDPDGGDLGRSWVGKVTPLEFQVLIPHISYILESLHLKNESRLLYSYAFEFNGYDRKQIEMVINSIKLPTHVKWYQTDGKNIFEIRGCSGGLATGMICYLVTGE